MKLILFTTLIVSFLFSCNDKKNASKEITSFVGTIDTSEGIHHADSLDLDTTSFITSNFPDTVHDILYNGIDTLWRYVNSSIKQIDKKHKQFSKDKLHQLLINSGFTIDSSSTQKFATKSDLNKRYMVDWLINKSDTITTQVRYWFEGKKYILINQRWNLEH